MSILVDRIERSWCREKRRSQVAVGEEPTVLYSREGRFLTTGWTFTTQAIERSDRSAVEIASQNEWSDGSAIKFLPRVYRTVGSDGEKTIKRFTFTAPWKPWQTTTYEIPVYRNSSPIVEKLKQLVKPRKP